MKANMGLVDRVVRVLVAVVIGVLWYLGEISGTAALILGVVALIFVATSAISFCPLYVPLKISTKKKQ